VLRWEYLKLVASLIINNQFVEMVRAMSYYNSIEMGGFGRFLFNPVKAKKYMEKYTACMRKYEVYT
jgi:hypothetical protein